MSGCVEVISNEDEKTYILAAFKVADELLEVIIPGASVRESNSVSERVVTFCNDFRTRYTEFMANSAQDIAANHKDAMMALPIDVAAYLKGIAKPLNNETSATMFANSGIAITGKQYDESMKELTG
jgi:hypothetical protein